MKHERLFLVAIALALVPLWLVETLPLADLPQHAAQIAMLRDFESSPHGYDEVFVLNWVTPYLLGYGLTIGEGYINVYLYEYHITASSSVIHPF